MKLSLTHVVVLVIGIMLFLSGYGGGTTPVDPDVTPDPVPTPTEIEVVLVPENEDYPDKPADPALEAVVNQLADVLANNPEDSVTLARTFRDWGDLLARDSAITDATMFQAVNSRSLQILFQKHPIAGKYRGQIDAILNNACRVALGLPESTVAGLPASLEMTPENREKLASAFEAVSYGCMRSYLNTVLPPVTSENRYTRGR